MKAFVKTTKGNFPNVNFYLAYDGFNKMGYSTQLFEEEDIPNISISKETPVFCGAKVFRDIMKSMKIDYSEFDCYPESLKDFYGRKIQTLTLGQVKESFDKNPIPIFVKPRKTKTFNGRLVKSSLQLISLYHKDDSTEVYTSEPISFVSEYRVYVHDKDIVGVKNYYGEWNIVPDVKTIKEIIRAYSEQPIAYGLDVGVTDKGETRIVEVNDACHLGNYGLDSIHYGEMLAARWFEITYKL